MSIKVSVIVPVYNRLDELGLVLNSLVNQTLPLKDFEVCIGDDGSNTDVEGFLREFVNLHPGLNVCYARQEDLGFRVAAARNLGMAQAIGEILVFNDNGMAMASDVLEKHVVLHAQHGTNLVALANMHGTGWGTDGAIVRQALLDNAPDFDKAVASLKESNLVDGRISYIFERKGYDINAYDSPWSALWGGHFSINAKFAKAHNIKWNEAFVGWGGEDNELGIQLTDAGANFQFFHDLNVVHYPTEGSLNLAVEDKAAFDKNYQRVKDLIRALHPNNPVVQAQYGAKA